MAWRCRELLMVMQGPVVALLLGFVMVGHSEAGWNQWTSMGPGGNPLPVAIDPGPLLVTPLAFILPGGNPLPVAIDPATPSTIYTARDTAVFKSTDGGAHWSATDIGPTVAVVTAVALDPQAPNTVYAGVAGTDAWGVFKSTDGGVHWSPRHAGFPQTPISLLSRLVVDPQNSATVYAATTVGVFKSTDAGGFWSAQNNGLFNTFVTALAMDPRTPTTLYLATLAGVFKSTDGGAHWTISDNGLPHVFAAPLQALPSVLSLTVDPHAPATVYAGTVQGVFKSTDGGESWSFSMNGVHFIGSHVSAVAIDPQTPGTLYAATVGAGIFKSTDAGHTWTPFSAGLYPVVTGLQISPSGACLHAAAWIGVASLVTRPDPCASPVNAFVSVNETSFEVGQTLTASVGLMNLGAQGPVDVYLGIIMPDDLTVAFFTSADTFAFGTWEDFTSYRPVATGISLASAFATTVPGFFSHRWTGAEPRGPYAFIFYAVRAGALADGVLSADEILAVASTSFSFREDLAELSWFP